MDCEAYRRAIDADPGGDFDGAAAHVAGCEACRAYTATLRDFDRRLARALAIDVPAFPLPELPAAPPRAERGRRRTRWLVTAAAALAVSLAGLAVLTLRSGAPGDAAGERLAAEVLAHMDGEASSRVVTTMAVSRAALEQVLEPRVRAFDTGGAIVSYAMSCVINGKLVPHLVVQGRTGPITLILLPDESVDDAIPLVGRNVHGVIVPAETGAIAIIGEREDQLPEIGDVGQRVVQSVQWRL
ncbi:MAG TPA: DUF3379 family protein [Woeseiaceae bacterium]|nr:DUF3379 family protein [Woeseiaceae bacterium]